MEVAEDFLGPQIHTAFAGITMGKLNHRDALRPEEQQKGDDPQPNRHPTVGGDRRHDIEIEHRDDEK